MTEIPVAELVLDVQEHEAVKQAKARQARAKASARRLAKILKERAAAAQEARQALGQIELDQALGKPIEKSEREAARQALERAESDLALARGETERRAETATGEEAAQLRAAVRQAAREASETLAPVVRALTQEYLEAVATAHRVGMQLEQIYRNVYWSDRAAAASGGLQHRIRTPHENPVLRLDLPHKLSRHVAFSPRDWASRAAAEQYAKVVEMHLETFRKLGYDINEKE